MHEHKGTCLNEQSQPAEEVITEDNFNDFFHPVHSTKPQHGEVIARYAAIAQFVDGKLKRDILDILVRLDEGAKTASKILRKLGGATDRHALKLAREMTEDLLSGMTVDQVAAKEYSYQVEFFWYTQKKYIPTEDPHWSCITVKNLDDFLDKSGKDGIKCKIVYPQENSQ